MKLRWIALVAAAALIVLAFVAASRVADTREGLIAEIVTLLAGGSGVSLGIYGLAARDRPASPPRRPPGDGRLRQRMFQPSRNPRTDLAFGVVGIGLAVFLLVGLGLSGGLGLAGLGLMVLSPMVAGSVYLCWRSLRTNQ